MAAKLLALVERLRSALEGTGTLTHGDLTALLDPDDSPAHLDQALRFLQGREAILIDAVDQSVHLRTHVTNAVLEALRDGPLSLEALDARAPVSLAMVCDVLGWLEREGRIVIDARDLVALR